MAGNILSELFIKIGADVKGLKAGLDSADSRMGKFATNIKKHHKAIGMAMTAVGGAILAAGALSIKTYMKMGDEVQKMALRTGFSTEALSELRHAAEISGTELSSLDAATKRMSKTIVDASEGMTTYIRAFDRIGLSVEDLIDLSPEEQFMKIAMAIGDLENHALKAATAQDIFGRAGTKLLPLLAAGTEGMEALRREAHDLGIVFDQEAANKAAKMTDAMHRVKEATSGLKMRIAEQLIPILIPLIDKIKEIISRIGDWMKQHPELAKLITIVSMALGVLLVVFGPLLIMLPGLTIAFHALGVAITFATWPISLIIIAIAALIAIGVLLWKNWDDISARAVKIWGGIVAYFQGIWRAISTIFNDIGEAMWKPIQVAVDAILAYINAIIAAIQRMWNFVISLVRGITGGRRGGGGVDRGKVAVGGYPTVEGEYIGGARAPSPTLQKGGIVRRPTLALIGEAGPEAIVPLGERALGEINITLSGIFMGNEAEARKLATLIRKYLRQDERFLYGGIIA